MSEVMRLSKKLQLLEVMLDFIFVQIRTGYALSSKAADSNGERSELE